MWKPTVSISLDDSIIATDCVELSTGSTMAGSDYVPGSIVPRDSWRPPTFAESEAMFFANGEGDPGRTVRVVRFPIELLEEFHRVVAYQGGLTPDNAPSITSSRDARKILIEFNRFASSLPRLNGEMAADGVNGGFCIKEPGLKTVSVHRQSKRFVGLHVDSWFGLPLGRRAQSPLRICANFGWSDRFLLFLNVAVDDIYATEVVETQNSRRLDWKREMSKLKGAPAIGNKFLNVFSDHPITRVRIRPGEAYVAPTENVVHDGSTQYGIFMDVSCHVNPQS